MAFPHCQAKRNADSTVIAPESAMAELMPLECPVT